ncbi:seminase [Drosophila teissieri]|uniref:seminase n=1 Tax=Drosophila teissieri TaxID=7243 RepID=UPI001CB9FC62|nr:seminase [Drosophila teissieri]
MGLPKSWLLVSCLLGSCVVQSQGKVYPRDIYMKTPKFRRVWGGVQSNTGDNFGGWLLRILNGDGNFACGAAYYAPILVITSANCIYPYRNSLEGATVEGTAFSECDRENIADIDTIKFPEKFVYQKLYMDVAVVRLREPIKGRLTEFIRLCTIKVQPRMQMVVFGWGFDSTEVQIPSSDPRNATVTIMSFKECRHNFKRNLKLTSTTVCARQPKNPRQCLYDGGSPLIYERELCGLVSFGSHCQDTSRPGIFTNIRRVHRFITEIEAEINAGEMGRSTRVARKVTKKPKKKSNSTSTRVRITRFYRSASVDPLEC